jgi:hypothetical protein
MDVWTIDQPPPLLALPALITQEQQQKLKPSHLVIIRTRASDCFAFHLRVRRWEQYACHAYNIAYVTYND